MTDLAGRRLGQYQILERIGQGGMATVYKAFQPGLDRHVAVKVLPLLYAGQPGFRQRFEREAKAIANLNHPNILPVHDFGHEGDYTFIVMRYIEGGRSLQQVMTHPLTLGQISDLIGQVAAALEYAHRRGIIHRDVKPSNVLMDGDWALLSDFGLAKVIESSVKLTQSDTGVGTPAYMSPEQAQGDAVDHRTDIYALGIILFEMLTGQIPHQAGTPMGIIIKRTLEPMPSPRSLNPAIPEAVEAVVLKALAYRAAGRFDSALALAAALKASLPSESLILFEPATATREEGATLPSSKPLPQESGLVLDEPETQPIPLAPASLAPVAEEMTAPALLPAQTEAELADQSVRRSLKFLEGLSVPLIAGIGIVLVLLLGLGLLNQEAVRAALFAAEPTATFTTVPAEKSNRAQVELPTPKSLPPAPPVPVATPTPTALPLAPAAEDETLILIATFYTAPGIIETDVHNEIRLAIEAAIEDLGFSKMRVEVEPTQLKAESQAEARALGEQYNASIIIWGGDTGVRITINYLNLKQPRLAPAQARISETERTQLADPSAYASFVTRDLPAQLTFLSLFTIGESYYSDQNYEAAARVIERAVAPFKTDIEPPEGVADAYFRLGWLYQGPLNDLEAAVAAYDQTLAYDPNYLVAYYNRGLAHIHLGQTGQAIEDYSRAIQLKPSYTVAYYNRGLAYVAAGDLKRAIEDYTQAIILEPDYANGWNNLCWFKSLAGQTEGVLEACDRAIALEPENGNFHDSRGLARALAGDYPGAVEDFQVYLEWLKAQDRYRPSGPEREAWIASLKAGTNPFDEATLKALQGE